MQWQEVGRHVKKGSKAFSILAPRFVKKEAENREDETKIPAGLLAVSIFRIEDTEGPPLDYERLELPPLPLIEVAQSWGMSIQKHLVLSNLHRAIEGNQEKLIVVEGFSDCFRIWQAGFKNVVALMGSTLSPEQEGLLVSHAKMVALMIDRDDVGMKATGEILPLLARRVFLKVIDLPAPGDQPDRLKEENLVNLLRNI
jgi:hypothetical protein